MTQMPKIPEDIRYEIRTFDRGEEILDGFSENGNLFIVLEGSADVFYYSEEGDIMHIYRYKWGDIFGELELFGSNPLPFPVKAAENLKAAVIPKDQVVAWIRKDPDFSLFLLKKMSEKLIKNTGKRTELRYLSGKERYLKAMDRHCLIGDLATLTKKQLCYETSLPLRSLNRIIRDCSDTYQYKNRGFFRVNNS